MNKKLIEFMNGIDTLYVMFMSSKATKIEVNGELLELDNFLIDLHLKFPSDELPFPYKLNIVGVKKSNISGNGVFAARDIKKGEIVTFYPCDTFKYWKGNNYAPWCSNRVIKKYNLTTPEDIHKYSTSSEYTFNLEPRKYSISGDPNFIDDPTFLGHMINDGAKSNGSEKSNEIYIKIAWLRMNCMFKTSPQYVFVYIQATKDIKKGEELLTPYGIDYWRTHKSNKRTY